MSYRICFISRSTQAHGRGGLERYASVLGSALAEAGHDVFMVTSAHPQGIQEDVRDGVKTHYVSGTVAGSYKGGFFVKSSRKFLALHAEKPFDVVHSHSYGALGLLRKVSVPVVATLHGVWFSETVYERDAFQTLSAKAQSRALISFPKIFLHHMAMHGFAKHANKIIFDSAYSKNEFRRLHPSWHDNRYEVVPAAVEVPNMSTASRQEARRLLGMNGKPCLFSLSRLEATKGFQTAFRAFRGVNDPSSFYMVGGEGKYKRQLMQLCENENIRNVLFLGHVQDEKLPLYYSAADIFVYPELVHPAFGLSVAEAMACGACVAASRRGALPEVVGDAGVLYTHNNENELKNVFVDLFAHPEKREALGRKARERIRTLYTKEIMLKKMTAVYQEVLTREPVNPLTR